MVELNDVLDGLPVGVIGIDEAGLIKIVNAEITRLFGYSSEELINKKIEMLAPEHDRDNHVHLRNDFIEKPSRRSMGGNKVIQCQRKDGRLFSAEIGLNPIKTESGNLVISSLMDITERMNANQLKIELVKVSQESKAKSTFLANMSHELRTPLNTIIGYSELIEEELLSQFQEYFISNYVDDLQHIQSSGAHLLNLINNILDISKIESGKMALYLETFDLPNLVSEIISELTPIININNNQLEFQCHEEIKTIVSDEIRLKQILFNLITNANKFTHYGNITISIHPDKENADFFLLEIKDTGIGISAENITKLFKEFIQAENKITKEYGGTGLGLSLCSRICQLFGGDISVESEIDVGSSFICYLPKVVKYNVKTTEPQPINKQERHQEYQRSLDGYLKKQLENIQRRLHDRYQIENLTCTLHMNDCDVNGVVRNISGGGIKCKFTDLPFHHDLIKNNVISLNFPDKFNTISIPEIKCQVVHIPQMQWLENEKHLKLLEIAYTFYDLAENELEMLKNNLNQVNQI